MILSKKRFISFGAAAGLTVSPSSANISGASTGVTAYAGISYNSSGEEFKTDTSGNSGYTVSRGNWLDVGTAAEVWVQMTRTGGTLGSWNSEDAGSTRLQLNTTRSWRILRTSPDGSDSIIADFDFYDAASGGNLLASVNFQCTATYNT